MDRNERHMVESHVSGTADLRPREYRGSWHDLELNFQSEVVSVTGYGSYNDYEELLFLLEDGSVEYVKLRKDEAQEYHCEKRRMTFLDNKKVLAIKHNSSGVVFFTSSGQVCTKITPRMTLIGTMQSFRVYRV